MLYAQKINYGQSEIWLGTDGKELTQRRTLATNEALNVTRRHCAHEVFLEFCADFNTIGDVAALAVSNMNDIATELMLET